MRFKSRTLHNVVAMPGGETVPNYKAVNETNCSIYRGTTMFKKKQHINTQYLTFRHRASCFIGQAFRFSPENAFYIFNQQIYFII